MDKFEIILKILLDLISTKKQFLNQILNITINQQELLKSKDSNQFFLQMNEEKQKLIQEVISIDNVFQNNFNKIKHNFDDVTIKKVYKLEIINLQSEIKEVLQIDEHIRKFESENKNNFNITKSPKELYKQSLNNN